jgi:putative tryptophan/tyrosine transport system ATP-binding protein
MEKILEIVNIHKIFNKGEHNEVYALKSINLDFTPGELVLIIGNNGSGKSTLLNLIDGRIPQTRGEIRVNGKSIDKLKVYQRSKFIFRLFQETLHGVIRVGTIRENLSFANKRQQSYSLTKALSSKEDEKYFKEVLNDVKPELVNHLDKKVFTLSPGERQALILALLKVQTNSKPQILLADEPTASLDPELAEKSFKIIRELSSNGWLCLVVTHDQNLIKGKEYSRIIKLKDGGIEYDK